MTATTSLVARERPVLIRGGFGLRPQVVIIFGIIRFGSHAKKTQKTENIGPEIFGFVEFFSGHTQKSKIFDQKFLLFVILRRFLGSHA